MRALLPSSAPPTRPTRRRALALGGAMLALAGCASSRSAASEYSASAPLPSGSPSADTSLRIAGRTTQLQLEAAGDAIEAPAFTIGEWVNVGAGPDVIQAFRAQSLDLASNAIIPPITAREIGFDARIVAVLERREPSYVFATAAGSDITAFGDFRDHRIAFSQGQSQGDTVLRTLQEGGIAYDEVELVDLPSTQFLTALQGGQVDVAPLSEPQVTKYIDQYGADGAIALPSEVPDLLTVLWAPTTVLAEEANLLAIRDYVRAWAQGQVWAWEHPEEWTRFYYVDTEGVTAEDAARIWSRIGAPRFPHSWDAAVEWARSSQQLLIDGGFIQGDFDAEDLFDRRFEEIAVAAVPAEYTVDAS